MLKYQIGLKNNPNVEYCSRNENQHAIPISNIVVNVMVTVEYN